MRDLQPAEAAGHPALGGHGPRWLEWDLAREWVCQGVWLEWDLAPTTWAVLDTRLQVKLGLTYLIFRSGKLYLELLPWNFEWLDLLERSELDTRSPWRPGPSSPGHPSLMRPLCCDLAIVTSLL